MDFSCALEECGLDLSPLSPGLEGDTFEGCRSPSSWSGVKDEFPCDIVHCDAGDIFPLSISSPAVFVVTCPSLPEETSQFFRQPNSVSNSENEAADLLASPKVGSLPAEVRRAKIERYRKKRARRRFVRKIEYQCRKRVADKRVRVKGRFITKKEEAALRPSN